MSNVKMNLETQIMEMEALQSVYPQELLISDHGNLADINDFVAGNREEIPQRLEYEIKVSTEKGIINLLINLPLDYPNVFPEIYCRGPTLDRNEQMQLNKALTLFTLSQEKGESMIYSLITWIQDNAQVYLKNSQSNNKSNVGKSKEVKKNDNFTRYWIYSHHIYSKIKRKTIVDLARDCRLSGFSSVGKPGIICVEGEFDDCEYFWQEIKAMNWHRILVKFLEKDFERIDDINLYRKFINFQEISFTSERHNDMGQLKRYLEEHQLDYAFKELFGIEGKNSQCVD